MKENFKSISENFHIIDKEVAILRATMVTKDQLIEARDELKNEIGAIKNEIGAIEGQVVKKISMYLGLPIAFFGIASGFLQITNYMKNISPPSVQQPLPVSSLKLLENIINSNRLQNDMYQTPSSQQLNGRYHDELLPEKKTVIRGKRSITQQN